MEMTGWLSGQVFLQTVDQQEVQRVSAFLGSRQIAFHVLTVNERMVMDPEKPEDAVSTDRYSIAIQLAGFPQAIAPLLDELVRRAHGGGWDEPTAG
jgi:hypothetical protein